MQTTKVTIRRHPDWLARAILSGFIATSVMLFAFVVTYGLSIVIASLEFFPQQGGQAISGWFQGLARNSVIDLASANLYLAFALFFAGGIVFAILYAYWFEPRLTGPAWLQGFEFGLIVWVFSLIVFFPIVGGGFLGLELGAGPLPIVGNLILHAVYGATLGIMYGPFGDIVVEHPVGPELEFPDDAPAMLRSEQTAALGIVIGGIIGGIIGVFGGIVAQAQPGGQVLGVAPLAFVVASAVIGGTCGALVGSLAGLPSTSTGTR